MSKKDPTDSQKIFITIEALDKRLHYLREHMDHWEYDYVKNKLTLLWSVPHRSMMKNFLRSPEKYDKNFIVWIKQYIKQENLNLDDPTAQVVSN